MTREELVAAREKAERMITYYGGEIGKNTAALERLVVAFGDEVPEARRLSFSIDHAKEQIPFNHAYVAAIDYMLANYPWEEA